MNRHLTPALQAPAPPRAARMGAKPTKPEGRSRASYPEVGLPPSDSSLDARAFFGGAPTLARPAARGSPCAWEQDARHDTVAP